MFEVLRPIQFGTSVYPIEVCEFEEVAAALDAELSFDESKELIDYLAFNPEAGEIIPETRGVRKIRWGYGEKGNRRALRLVYYFHDLNMPLYVLAVYKPGESMRLTKNEKTDIAQKVAELVEIHATKNLEKIERVGTIA
ncbi:addiction module toxin RelE [Hyphococcus lacteus]|uniref:Addiction module toxin RelE n=1 Tax=Hyphococcus lacteus TaxID=3143536 RepID=A0ABV3Z1H1_9PROT